jgi:hypothetical protein
VSAYVLAIDYYLDELKERGQATFHVREMAEWYVDQYHRGLSARQRKSLVDSTVPRLSTWLQQYWQNQTRRSYRFSINSEGWGPSARWSFEAGGDEDYTAERFESRVRKNLEVTLVNAVDRSVASLIDEPADRERLAEALSAGVDLLVEEVMSILNSASA